jgi:hypothetical protein
MRDLLLLNVRAHLRFFARNRLLLAFGVVLAVMMGLSTIPMFLFETSANRFSALQTLVAQANNTALIFTASLGLFAVSSHLRSRNLKMVLTKPCPPSVWLASVFLAALLVGVALHGVVALSGTALSLAWDIPLQPGLAFVSVDSLLQATIWLSVLTTLTVVVHPVLAVLFALLVSDSTFYGLEYMIESSVATSGPSSGLTVAGVVVGSFYTLLPMTAPFGERMEDVHGSWRVAGGDWLVLGGAVGYASLLTVFLYLLSLYLLRRRALV